MIGPKKLSAIRQELQRALTATGDDPIRWLEERMSSPETESSAVSGESEILQSLRRILETTGKAKRRKQRGGTKK
jgi:hypothetical protein